MRHHRLHRHQTTSFRFSSTGCGDSSTAATIQRASRWYATGGSSCGAARASCATRGGDRWATRSTASTASGHTRWATHGRPTEENAHPHRDCTGNIVVVHNGIIENYLDLKRDLQREGTRSSPKPTRKSSPTWSSARCATTASRRRCGARCCCMRGLFALVLISTDDPDKIVAVRNGPPLVVGLGDGEFFVASDIPAILSHTRDVVFLGDEEMAVVTRRGVEFTDVSGRAVSKAEQRVLWDPIMAEKAGYKHFMLKEIFEQPHAPRETRSSAASRSDSGKVFLDEMNIARRQLRAVNKVDVLACGTSWHAGLVGKLMIEQLARLPVEVDYGSEYRYRNPIVGQHDAGRRDHAVGRDGRHARRAARGEARRARAASPSATWSAAWPRARRMARSTRTPGPEIGVASTKAFTSQLVALYLLALYLGQVRGTLTPEASRPHIDALLQLPLLLEQVLKARPADRRGRRAVPRPYRLPLPRARHQLPDRARGRAQAQGDLLHPRRGLSRRRDEARPDRAHRRADAGRGHRAARRVFEKMIGNMQEAKARGGSVIALTDPGDDKLSQLLDRHATSIFDVPRTPELLTPIVTVMPLQLLAYHIAVRRGCDVDQPRNLAKSVTVE